MQAYAHHIDEGGAGFSKLYAAIGSPDQQGTKSCRGHRRQSVCEQYLLGMWNTRDAPSYSGSLQWHYNLPLVVFGAEYKNARCALYSLIWYQDAKDEASW